MGNNIASMFVQRLRRSGTGSTLISQTSSTPPLFLYPDEIPGVVRAFVTFNGITPAGNPCEIVKKSTNVVGVSSQTTRGDYLIEFQENTFDNRNYTVVGSVYSDSTQTISAANTFFVKGSGYAVAGFVGPGQQQTEKFIRIQTANVTTTATPAFASRVSLLFYK